MLLWSVPTRRLLRRYDKSEATAPTPTRAGRGRWGRRRTGWRRCCLRWVSHRSAGWWPTRSSPPSRCSSRNLKTDGRRGNWRITFYTQTTNHQHLSDTWWFMTEDVLWHHHRFLPEYCMWAPRNESSIDPTRPATPPYRMIGHWGSDVCRSLTNSSCVIK